MIIHDLVTPFQSHRPQAFPYLPTSSRKALIGIRCDGGFPLILRRQFFFDQVLSIAFVHDGPQIDVMHGFALVHVHHVFAHVAAQTGSVRAVRAFEGPFQAEIVVVFHSAVFALLVNAPHVIIVTGFRPEVGAANVATPTVARAVNSFRVEVDEFLRAKDLATNQARSLSIVLRQMLIRNVFLHDGLDRGLVIAAGTAKETPILKVFAVFDPKMVPEFLLVVRLKFSTIFALEFFVTRRTMNSSVTLEVKRIAKHLITIGTGNFLRFSVDILDVGF